jgi:predicted DNA-binding transcriptional regulator AlpA
MDEKPNQTCQLLSAKQLSKLLSTSVRSVWRYRSANALPQPVKVGGALRWRQADIEKWIRMGCPNRKEWEQFKDLVDGGEK